VRQALSFALVRLGTKSRSGRSSSGASNECNRPTSSTRYVLGGPAKIHTIGGATSNKMSALDLFFLWVDIF
jgi:hypothetical protein